MQGSRRLSVAALLFMPAVGWGQQTRLCRPSEASQSTIVLATTRDRPRVLQIRAVSIRPGSPLPKPEVRVVGLSEWRLVEDSVEIALSEHSGQSIVVEVRAIGHGIARTKAHLAVDSGLIALAVMVPIMMQLDGLCEAGRPEVFLKDGPAAWDGFWDDAAIVLNERTVYCPERSAQDSVPRLGTKLLRGLKPELIEHMEVKRVAPAWLGAVCGRQLARVLHLQYRGKPPRGGKARR